MLGLGLRLFGVFNRFTSDERESVLIIDDSPYDRSRSKLVELLSRIRDHSTGRFLKGFRMLTICWSDGTSCLPMDFALLSSTDTKKRLCESQKALDKHCCAYQRRKEATQKATAHLENMVKRILSAGVSAKYLLYAGAIPNFDVGGRSIKPIVGITPIRSLMYAKRFCIQ